MPYLEYVKCSSCDNGMDIDNGATIRAYYEEGRPDKDNFINPATIIWDYLVYSCYHCGKSEKYKFRDIELIVREHFSMMTEKHREIFNKLDHVDFDTHGRVVLPTRKEYKKVTTDRLEKAYKKQ